MITATHSEVHSASVEGNGTLLTHRPLRAPHHTVSTSALAGCASNPRMQMLTIEDLLHGAEVKMPPQYSTFKEARRARMGGKHIPSSTSRLAIAAASRLP
jgi:hypothetical protein